MEEFIKLSMPINGGIIVPCLINVRAIQCIIPNSDGDTVIRLQGGENFITNRPFDEVQNLVRKYVIFSVLGNESSN